MLSDKIMSFMQLVPAATNLLETFYSVPMLNPFYSSPMYHHKALSLFELHFSISLY